MPSENTTLDGKAEEAIDKVFYDTSVPEGRTKERLEALRKHIDHLLETLVEA